MTGGGAFAVALAALLLTAGVASAAEGDDVASDRRGSIEASIDEVVELPGHEIRRSYLQQLLERQGLAPAERAGLQAAIEVLDAVAVAGGTTRDRLRTLLLLGASEDPTDRELALHAARTGMELGRGEEPEPEASSTDNKPPGDWLDEIDVGVGPIAWGTDRYRVAVQLGGKVDWTPISQWPGPRYKTETGFFQFDSSIAGCGGEFSLFLGERGLSRFWFSTSEARCWLLLKDHLVARRGEPSSQTIETDEVAARVLEWSGRVPIKLAVEGETATSLFLSAEAPDDALAPEPDTDPYGDAGSDRERRAIAKQRDRLERGRRLNRDGAIAGTTGVVFLLGSIASGIAGGIVLTRDPGMTEGYVLAGTSGAVGLAGGTLLAVGVAQSTHGAVLLRKAQTTGLRVPVEVGVGLCGGSPAISIRW